MNKAAKSFITEDFLLQSPFAKKLYHDYAKDLPIIDYHNHLSPAEIAENRQFENCTQVWLSGDHYKWRAMRALAIEEQYITGKATDEEKFLKWAEAVPYTVRNPLYHWTHLELQRYFGISELLTSETAKTIYATANSQLKNASHTSLGLLSQMKVEVVCTTDDPADGLEHHLAAQQKDLGLQLLPTFRPDKAYAIEDTAVYLKYLEKLGTTANMVISQFGDLLSALENRIDDFHQIGGRLADHGLEKLYYFENGFKDIDAIFTKIKEGKTLEADEVNYYKFQVLQFVCKCYHKRGWTQQFHLGALRNTNTRMLKTLGPDTGFDSIGDFTQAQALGKFLNHLDSTDQLTKTVLYNLNPADNEVLATMAGNFNDGSIKGKVQYGSGWWYLDQKDGIEKQLNTLSNMGLLSCFIGMLTDSRSFLSFPRHEYFRRVLCNLFGQDVLRGELPADEKWLGHLVQDICYNNAKAYFDF